MGHCYCHDLPEPKICGTCKSRMKDKNVVPKKTKLGQGLIKAIKSLLKREGK